MLDRHQKGLPDEYRFYAFWFGGGSLRQSGVTGAANVLQGGRLDILAEFVHPPFGYVLSLQGGFRDRRPELISDFANYDLDEAVTLHRRIPVLETHWVLPGDYRTREEIERDSLVNELRARGVHDAAEVVDQAERRG